MGRVARLLKHRWTDQRDVDRALPPEALAGCFDLDHYLRSVDAIFARAASVARPPRRDTVTAAVAAGPPPTDSKRVARYFAPRSGSTGTVNTKSCTA